MSNFCTVAWQLTRLLLTRRIARSLSELLVTCLPLESDNAVWFSSKFDVGQGRLSLSTNGATEPWTIFWQGDTVAAEREPIRGSERFLGIIMSKGQAIFAPLPNF